MSFDLPADLESRVAEYAARTNVTTHTAYVELIEDGLRHELTDKAVSRDPEGTIGLFADFPEFSETMEQVVAGREARYSKQA